MSDSAETADLRPLPRYLRPGLRMVFIGYNPGIESARRGHYYAFGGNVFWRQLNASGLVARPVGPEDDALLMDEAGIGFTDLCPRPTVSADQLSKQEMREGALRLHAELLDAGPLAAVFSGRGIYDAYARHALGRSGADLATRAYGPQPELLGATTWAWVIPSSSGLASRWHRERLELLRRLAASLADMDVARPEARA